MPKFTINCTEISTATYEVEAADKEAALKVFNNLHLDQATDRSLCETYGIEITTPEVVE